MKKILLLTFIFFTSFTKIESPIAIAQFDAILTADVIFEGEIIKQDEFEITIKITTPIYNGTRNKLLLKQKEIKLDYFKSAQYYSKPHIPDIGKMAIFVFKYDNNSKKLKHFFYSSYLSKFDNWDNTGSKYYIAGKYSDSKRENISPEIIISGIKILKNSFYNKDTVLGEAPIKSKTTIDKLEEIKKSNYAFKIWVEDIEAFNKTLK